MQLKDLLALPTFHDFQLLAGADGLQQEIGNVDILEYEWFTQNFNVFSENDFVLTSLFFARDDASLIRKSIEKLLSRHISALAVKTIFFSELPPEVIALCDAHHLPLFRFSQAYMEDLIISFNELQKSDQRTLLLEKNLHYILHTNIDPAIIESTAHEINPAFLPHAIAFYLTDRLDPHSPRRIVSVLNRLLYKQYREQHLRTVSFLKFDNGLLVLYSLQEKELKQTPWELIRDLLHGYDLRAEDYAIGISSCQPIYRSLHQILQESLDAHKICQQSDKPYVSYAQLGIYRQLLPLSRSQAFQHQLQEVTHTLRTYDSKFSSRLLETLLAYTKNGGEISATAHQLYQHPNTIRYRLSKAKELLAPYLGTEHFYEQIFNLLTVYPLIKNEPEAVFKNRKDV